MADFQRHRRILEKPTRNDAETQNDNGDEPLPSLSLNGQGDETTTRTQRE